MSTDLEVNAVLEIKDFSKAADAYRFAVEEMNRAIKGEPPKIKIGPLPPPMSREGVNGLYLALRRYEISRTRIK